MCVLYIMSTHSLGKRPIPESNEKAQEKAAAAKQSREKTNHHHEEIKTWALPSINPPKSPKSTSLFKKMRHNEPENSSTPSVFLEDLYSNTGKLPTQATTNYKHHSQKKSSDTIDPFDAKGSVASLLRSVRDMKLGGKRTKKLRKNHKKTRKAKSHKNRRHSAKK